MGAHTQPGAGQEAEAKARQQAQRQRLADDHGNLLGFVDVSSDDEDVTIIQALGDRTDNLVFPAAAIDPADVGALRRRVDFQLRRQAVDIAGNPATIGAEDRCYLYASDICLQAFVDRLDPPFRRQDGDGVELRSYHAIRTCRQVVIGLPVDESNSTMTKMANTAATRKAQWNVFERRKCG